MARRYIQSPQGQAAREVIAWELFDTKTYINGGGTLMFFLTPNQTSPLTSNMHASGQLPTPHRLDVYGMAVEIFPGFAQSYAYGIKKLWVSEKKKIRELCWLEFYVGDKPYLIQPLIEIPEGVGCTGLTSGADESTGAVDELCMVNGIQDVKHKYDLWVPIKGEKDPIEIPEQQGFKVLLQWDANAPNLSDTGQSDLTVYIRVILIGYLWREVQ